MCIEMCLISQPGNCLTFSWRMSGDLGIQQCFGVVYHELTTLRRVYFARAALAVRAK